MTQKKETKNLYQKLHAVMCGCKKLIKQEGGGLPYKSVTHNMVSAQIKQQFKEHGLIFIPICKSSSKDGNIHSVTVACEIIDIDSGDKLPIGDFPGSGIDSQDKGYGKALSYAFKYLLQKLFLMEIGTDEEVDHNSQEAKTEKDQTKEKVKKYCTDVTKTLNNIRKSENTNAVQKKEMLDKLIQQEENNMISLETIDPKQHAILQEQIDKLDREIMVQ
jgi:hypothetical protein